jgi:secretion/DNA translocation related CpaE-like protein
LAVVTDLHLRDELDRVAAAVGVRVVHAGAGSVVSRKTWSAAAAVVLDQAAADRCGQAALPRRAHVSVLTNIEAATATWAAAITVGAQHVLRLPEQEGELVRELAEAAESARDGGIRGQVVAVIGGCGGAGASLFAVALAQAATDALLVDLDPWGGGIDLLVGGETTPGLRWPDLALQSGRLNWSAVREALPRHRGISLLSGTRRGCELDAGPVNAVADIAGLPLLASMRAQPRLAEQLEHGGLRLRSRSALAEAARRVLAVLPGPGSGQNGRAA